MGSPIIWGGSGATSLQSSLIIPGSTSGALTLKPSAATTSYAVIFPAAQGTGALTNDGSGNLSWTAGGAGSVTSVAMTVPSFLSIAGSPITTSGTLALTLSGTALPVVNGGTGDTSLTAYAVLAGGTTSTGAIQSVSGVGTAGQVLTSNGASALPTWQNGASAPAIIASYYSNAASITPGATTQINFNTSIIDTNSAVTTGAGAWKFTAPSTTNYVIQVMLKSSTSYNLSIYKNGSPAWTFSDGAGATANAQYVYTTTIPLTAGDFIDFRPSNGSVAFAGGSTNLDTSVSIISVAAAPTAPAYWMGQYSNGTSWSRAATSTPSDFTTGTSVSLSTVANSGITAVDHGSNICGIDATLLSTGVHFVSATGQVDAGSGDVVHVQLVDGSNTVINNSISVIGSLGFFHVQGYYNAASTSTTFKLRVYSNGATTITLESRGGSTANTLHWMINQLK